MGDRPYTSLRNPLYSGDSGVPGKSGILKEDTGHYLAQGTDDPCPDAKYRYGPTDSALVVLFGGMADGSTGMVSSYLFDKVASVAEGARILTFSWDEGWGAAERVYEFVRQRRTKPVVLIGHSLGASNGVFDCAEELDKLNFLAKMQQRMQIQLIITLDPVSRFSSPPTKPQNVMKWTNIYTTKGSGFFEKYVVPFGNDWDGDGIETEEGVVESYDVSGRGDGKINHGAANLMFSEHEVQVAFKTALLKTPNQPAVIPCLPDRQTSKSHFPRRK